MNGLALFLFALAICIFCAMAISSCNMASSLDDDEEGEE